MPDTNSEVEIRKYSDPVKMMADCLADVACHIVTDYAVCGFCDQPHGERVPDGRVPEESVSTGDLDGRVVVRDCRCQKFMRYAKFVYDHRYLLAETLRAFSGREKAQAEALATALGPVARNCLAMSGCDHKWEMVRTGDMKCTKCGAVFTRDDAHHALTGE